MLAAINWHSFLFLLCGGLACAFALGVLLSTNIVRMAFYLIVSLASTAGLFFLAGAKFVGAMQIMIYVGGTLVLLIFGVMLTAQAAFVSMKTRSSDWVLASIVGGSLLAVLLVAAVSVEDWRVPREDQRALAAAEGESATSLGWSLIGVRVDKSRQSDDTLRAGMSGYLLPFEIVSVHLLVVLIGAAFLARTKTIVSYARPETAIAPLYKIYFSFTGRVPRHIYWIHAVVVLGIVQALFAAAFQFLTFDEIVYGSLQAGELSAAWSRWLEANGGVAACGWLFGGLVLLWTSLAIRVKRWQDRGKSALWILIPLVPVIGAIWEVVELGFLRGTVGQNQYGADPLR